MLPASAFSPTERKINTRDLPDSNPPGFARRALIVTGVVVGLLVVIALLVYAFDVLLLVFGAILVAIVLRAPADWLARKTPLSPAWALALVVLALVGVIGAGVWLMGAQLAQQTTDMIDQLPQVIAAVRERIGQYRLGRLALSWIDTASFQPRSDLMSRAVGVVSGGFTALGHVVILLVIGLYLAAQPRLYLNGFLHLISPRRRERVRHVLLDCGKALRGWLVAQLIAMVIIGTLWGIGLTVIGVPFAIPLAIFAGLLNFIPYLGPILSGIPAVLVALSVGTAQAGYALGLYVAIQSAESYLITPLVEQRAAKLPPAAVLAFQVLMTLLAGIPGIIFASPLYAALMVLVTRLYVEDVLGDRTPAYLKV